jgi:putative endonuclease
MGKPTVQPARPARAQDRMGSRSAQTRAARARAAAELGRTAEVIAARFLASRGLEILLRNFRRRLGEIDLVARDRDVLAIVEVRTRSSQQYGGAAGSIDWRKRTRIVRATQLLLRNHPQYAAMRIRFDVIVVFDALAENPRVQWLKHAFQEC